jgi:hypothetical protein
LGIFDFLRNQKGSSWPRLEFTMELPWQWRGCYNRALLICGRILSNPHHSSSAQSRALGRKASLSSVFPSVEGAIARCITVATKPHGGRELGLRRPSRPTLWVEIHPVSRGESRHSLRVYQSSPIKHPTLRASARVFARSEDCGHRMAGDHKSNSPACRQI